MSRGVGARTFVMTGGGTAGHVIPAIAVARELRSRGHQVLFIGTRTGLEAKLVPQAGFPLETIDIGGLKRVGVAQTVRTLLQLPLSVAHCVGLLGRSHAAALFSMGGYVAGPAMIAAALRRLPMVQMEPNAMPGLTARIMGRFVERALLSFEAAARFFPAGRTERTGLPVRDEFFRIPPKPPGGTFTLLVTGGSRGSRTLNEAMRASWPLFRREGLPLRIVHQTGAAADHAALAREMAAAGLDGEVTPFLDDMPAAFAQADLVVCRSGAGAVSELAAAGKPAILVPFPYASDDHQRHNASAMEQAGAARLLLDRDATGERLFKEVFALARDPERLARMGAAARHLARPGAARRAADVLEELAGRREP